MRGVNIKVILPSDGMAGKWEPPYKTLYLLPGYSATATELITYLGLRGQSELKGIAIVLPDGENLFYQDLPDRMTFYSTYVGKELVEVTRKMLPLSTKGKTLLSVEFPWGDMEHYIMALNIVTLFKSSGIFPGIGRLYAACRRRCTRIFEKAVRGNLRKQRSLLWQ